MEIHEGERESTEIIFKRIGVAIPVTSTQHNFDAHSAPLQALAVSNKFGLTVVAHPQGFCVARTSELLRLAEDIKDKKRESTVHDVSIADVPLAGVSILALSSDELTLAASVGGTVNFFSVPDLVHKGNLKPFQSILICETQYTKEFIWCTAKENAYLALSCEGVLTWGEIGSSLKHTEEKVITVDWSADGRHFAVLTNDKKLSILSSDFQKKSQLQLPAKLQATSAGNDIKMNVDSIKWIRRDCIIIGCVGVNEGEECEYPVYILTSSSGDISQDLSGAEMLAFDYLFSAINGSILPSNNGPYLLLSYLDFWDLAVVANRRSIDDHIVLLGWVLDNGKKVAWLEILDETSLPRIEMQENGDENSVVGIAMDRTSTAFQISIPTVEGMKKLPPCPVLLCMTIEGKLNLFSFARNAEELHVSQVVVAPTNVPTSHALMARLKENFEFQKSSLSDLDSKILETKENVKVMATKAIKPGSKMLNMEDSKAFDLQKAYDEPIPSEKSSSTTLLPKVDVNSKIFHVTKHDDFSVDRNENESRQSIKNSFETFSSGQTTPLQSASKSSLAEGFSSSIPGSNMSVVTKSVSPDEGFHKFGSFSTQPASGSVFSNMTKFNTQNVTSKADLSGSFDKDVSGKGSLRSPFETMPKAGFGAAPFGSRQSSGGLLSSSMSTSNPSSVLASSALGALVTEIKDSYQGNTSFTGAVASCHSANVMNSADSTSISQSGTKTFTFSTSASESSLRAMVQPQQSSESLVPVNTQKLSRRTPGMSEIEADFSQELEEVRSMAKEVDDLTLTIEGNKMSRPNNVSFSKHAVLSVENKIKKLTENCNVFKERLEDQVFDIQHLQDKLMQVDAWRIYMQSVIKQAADQQYQDLRNQQRLDPELGKKQQSITKGEERLKQQILDLERHLQNLEISKFGVNNHPRRAQQKKIEITRQQQHLQNLYNTVNSQLEVAEKLAVCLSKQMEALHISPDNSAKSKNTTKESLFKSIGLSPSEASFLSPSLKEKSSNSNSLQKFANSPSYSASKESPIRKESIVQEQDSMRRRRNPIDSEWANVGTVKTTVKRASLPSSSRANRSKLTESEISQLRTSSEMFGHDGSISPMDRSHIFEDTSHIFEAKDEFKEPSKNIGLNISSNAAAGTCTGHSPESIFKWTTQAPADSLKSKAADSRYHLKSPYLVDDRRQPKDGSDLIHNSSAFSSHPKTRTPNRIPTSPFEVTDGSQCDSLMGLTPSIMRSSFEPIAEASFGFPKAKTSTDIVPEKHISSLSNTTKVSQQPHEPGSAQIKSLFSKGRVPESNSAASAVLPSKLATSLQASSFPTLLKSTSSNAEGPGYASEVGSTSPAIPYGKPFVFSKATSNATVSQSAKASSASSEAKSSFIASSGSDVKSIFPQGMPLFGSKTQNDVVAEAASQPKSLLSVLSLATSTGQTIAMTSGDESRISAAQVSLLFDSKPQNADATVTTSLPKPFSFSMPSFAALGGPNMATISGHESRTSTPQDPALFGSKPEQIMAWGAASQPKSVFPSLSSVSSAQSRNSLSEVTSSPLNLSTTAQVSVLGGSASSDQSKTGLTHPPQLGLSSSVTTISSLAPTSVSLASPFASSSSQPKPLIEGFSTSSATTSVPSFSFSSAPEAGFGQVSSHPSGSSGFGQFSASLSGTSAFGIQTSAVLSSSTAFGFSNSSSVQMTQTHSAPSFAQNMVTISSVSGSPAIPPPVSNEEDMEEEASSQPSDANIVGFSGFGLGSATPSNPKSNPFGQTLINSQSSNAFSLSIPQGELFKPASFTIPAAQSSPQLTPTFSNSFGSGGGISPSPATGSAFGQPAHPGPGQQALGSALGTFGQSRQIGLGGDFGAGFGSPNLLSGSGFKTTASAGGFSGAAGGGGFAAAATSGGGFAAAATSGGGFAAAANVAGGGFSGFQAFSGNQGSSGFSSLGGLSGSPNAPQSLFTQMRK